MPMATKQARIISTLGVSFIFIAFLGKQVSSEFIFLWTVVL